MAVEDQSYLELAEQLDVLLPVSLGEELSSEDVSKD